MTRLSGVLVFAAGVTTFVVTTVAVGTLVRPVVDATLLVAFPVAIGTGMAATTVVYVGLADDTDSDHYRFALSLGAMGVAFVAVLLGAVAGGIGLRRVRAAVTATSATRADRPQRILRC
jgi:hypothetical protein